jgi:Cu/Ag efflux protein CusF
MRKGLFALMFVSACLFSHAAAGGTGLEPHNVNSSVEEAAKKQIAGTIVSVDAENKMLSIQELSAPIMITSATVFDDDVQLDKLKPGTKVQLVLVTNADNKIEAAEVHKAG